MPAFRTISRKQAILSVAVFCVLLILFRLLACLSDPARTQGHWYGVIPPILAVILAFLTGNVMLSLGAAVIAGGLLIQVENMTPLFLLEGASVALGFAADAATSKTNLTMLGFVVVIFAMIEVVIASGGFHGVIRYMSRFVRTRKAAELMTAVLGVGFFIDDYASAIVVGSSMRPLTDRFAVSREKLAFIVDATSAPVTGLAVISTWIAYEVSLFNSIREQLGIERSGYSMFFDALSFRFYCVLMILFVFVQILLGRDFGPMRDAEDRAKRKGAAPEQTKPVELNHAPPCEYVAAGKARSALIPIFALIIFHLTALWFVGGGYARLETASAATVAYWRDTISSVANSARVLLVSGLFGLAVACLFAYVSEKLSVRRISLAIIRGARKSLLPFAILILAWSVKNCCDALHTGSFLASVLAGNVAPYLFPPMLFVTGVLISFATGTSYGTMAILIPTAIPVAFAIDGNTYGITTIMSLGAVLDGAIVGDHCSPISDTTILSATATRCDLLAHVRTQLPYSIFVTILALVCGYIPAAFGLRWIYSVAGALAVIIGAFMLLPRVRKRPPEKDLLEVTEVTSSVGISER